MKTKPTKQWITTYKPQGGVTEVYLFANDEYAASLHYGAMTFGLTRAGDRIGRTRKAVDLGAAVDELLGRGEHVAVLNWSDAWQRFMPIFVAA